MTAIIWQIFIGLGIFLYGMSRLESGIGALGSARLKHWLGRSTGTPLGSAGFGALVTAILQSSSMVSLLVLAFASAGLMPLYNAIGVLLGANLGTTITGWIVATLGFKLDLAQLALPLLGLGGLSQVLLKPGKRLRDLGKVALGLGLLLFGLSLMKDSVGDLPQRWDIRLLQGYHPVVYLLAGTVVTALIQSSSAAVMLTLTALNGGLITLSEAGALVIGADLGTTSTTLLASITGPAIKRQLAVAQLVFNLVVDIGAFLLLLPLLPAAIAWLGLTDPLYSVVAFHSALNLLGLLVFLPLLRPYANWVGKTFKPPRDGIAALSDIDTPVPEAALPAIGDAARRLWLQGAANNLRLFALRPEDLQLPEKLHQALLEANTDNRNVGDVARVYEQIKQREQALLQLSFKLQQVPLNESQSRRLQSLLEMTRSVVYASKTLQDIRGDIDDIKIAIKRDNNEAIAWLYRQQRAFQRELYQQILTLADEQQSTEGLARQLGLLQASNDLHFQEMDTGVYQRAQAATRHEPALSTQLNINREINHCTRSLLTALALWQGEL